MKNKYKDCDHVMGYKYGYEGGMFLNNFSDCERGFFPDISFPYCPRCGAGLCGLYWEGMPLVIPTV